MAGKTEFSEPDFVTILANYNLGDYQESRPLTAGTVQTNYRVQTTNGVFVFRYYESRARESVLFEVHLIRYIRQRNFPCPAPFRSKSGDYVGVYRRKPYVVFQFVEGEHIENPSIDQRTALIRAAAQLQTITKNYRPTYRRFRWNYSSALCEQLAQEAAERIGDANARAKLGWLRQALADLRLPPSLPKGICHCDFHFSNALFRDGQFVALLDFDDANTTFLTFDLVHLMDWWAWPVDGTFDFAEARAIVQAYQTYRPLSDNEKRHIFDVHKLQILIDCVWFFARGDVADFFERRKIESLDYLGRDAYYAKLLD